MSSVLKQYFRKRRPRFHEFVAHGLVRRALRHVPEMKLSAPPVIGVVAGENPPVLEIRDALSLLRLPDLGVFDSPYPEAMCVFLDCEPAEKQSPRQIKHAEEEFLYAVKGKNAIFAVAAHEGDLPDLFKKMADEIIYLERPTGRLIQAAFRYCLGIHITLSEAEELTKCSLFDLTLAASRGRAWRRVLDAITEGASDDSDATGQKDVSLETLPGLREAGQWGQELASDLQDWNAGKLPWSEVSRGVLIAGPTGTGKTVPRQHLWV